MDPEEQISSLITPLSFPISSRPSTSSKPNFPIAKPKLNGLFYKSKLSNNPTISLTNFHTDLPIQDEMENQLSQPSDPSTSIQNPLSSGFDKGKRRHRQRKRIARPKDSMPGYSRRWANKKGNNSRSRFPMARSAGAAGGSKHLDRKSSSQRYYNNSDPAFQGDDETQDNHQTELAAINFLNSLEGDKQEKGAPICHTHGSPTKRLKVKKRGANNGRYFFVCERKSDGIQCDFFQWADLPSTAIPIEDDTNSVLFKDHAVPDTRSTLSPQFSVDSDEDGVSEEKLREALQELADHTSFRPGQVSALQSLLNGNSVLACLPTGSGKSIIYHLFAFTQPGLILVISPLIALLRDQLAALPECIKGECLRAGQSEETQRDIQERLLGGEIKVLFISPERLFSNRFRSLVTNPTFPIISLVVVDEAHCVSQWSHHFRVAYLRMTRVLFPSTNTVESSTMSSESLFPVKPLVLALTATATPTTTDDICSTLRIDRDTGVVRCDSGRENLHLTLSKADHDIDAKAFDLVRRLKMDPFRQILGIQGDFRKRIPSKNMENSEHEKTDPPSAKRRRTANADEDLSIAWGSTKRVPKRIGRRSSNLLGERNGTIIIYVSKQRHCDTVHNYLQSSSLPVRGKIEKYHAGMGSLERTKVEAMFRKGKIAILVATVAFGMGVNYTDVLGVIHFDIPSSLEAYSQEIGRAGRDGSMAFCHVFYSPYDICRMVSRSHANGIDKSYVRQFLRSLLGSSFVYKSLQDIMEKEDLDSGETSDKDDEASMEKNRENDDWKGEQALRKRVIVSLTEQELNADLDMSTETAETISALLEGMTKSVTLLGRNSAKASIRFFSDSPENLLKKNLRGVTKYDKLLLRCILKHAKRKKEEYILTFIHAGLLDRQVIGSLRNLSRARHIQFELQDSVLQLECNEEELNTIRSKTESYADEIHRNLDKISSVRIEKAKTIANVFRKADGLLTDSDQSDYLHRAIESYFSTEESTVPNEEETVKESKDRLDKVRAGARAVCLERRFGKRTVQSGRQIARILHGIDSTAFRAKDWYSYRLWGKFIDVAFECVLEITSQVLKEARVGKMMKLEKKRSAKDRDSIECSE